MAMRPYVHVRRPKTSERGLPTHDGILYTERAHTVLVELQSPLGCLRRIDKVGVENLCLVPLTGLWEVHFESRNAQSGPL